MATTFIKNIAQAIHESSKGKSDEDLNFLIKNTIDLINKKRMLGQTDKILSTLEKIIDKEEGITRAKIYSRSKISNQKIKEVEEFIRKKYKSEKVILTNIENPKLLGGIKIEIENEILDATLSNKIQKLQTYLIEN